ncbi:unnamed protein product [Larinioides sclopetarius]|uniref:Cysteine protease n=1 Tax=Larinioides sclopetarius TaxID=280406 RepID=A0AAV1Z9M0_9ARAC
MSNVKPSDVQGEELDSLCASGNFEVLCCDTCDDENVFERQYFSNSDSTTHPNGSSNKQNTSSLGLSSKTYSSDPQTFKTFDVDDLIQSHIAADDELSSLDQDSQDVNSGYCTYGGAVSEKVKSSKSSSSTPVSNSPSKYSDETSKDSKRSKTNSTSFHLGQILNKRKGSGSDRTHISDDPNVNDLAINSRPFVFKKQNVSVNSNDSSQQTQMKTKLRTMWNNMKYGWRVKREVNLKLDSATWLLGQCYHNKLTDGPVLQDVSKQLKLDLLSRILLTYRINFPTIPGTDYISDSGWGCMLRCGQMMMAQALVCHFLHRDWRISPDQPPEKKQLYKMILRWFGDTLSDNSPFSLHHLVSLGENYGRKAGDWYGPTHAAQVLRDALIQAKRDHSELRDVCMYVALDGIVFKQDVMDLCLKPIQRSSIPVLESGKISTTNNLFCKPYSVGQNYSLSSEGNSNTFSSIGYGPDSVPFSEFDESDASFSDPCPSYSNFGPPSFCTFEPAWTSLILFVSVRLGNDKINPFYIPCLKSLLAYEHCIGIIGGRPKHALYFIGWQDDKLIHMDPHSCQPAIDVEKDDFNEKSFHSSSIRTMSFTEMDPSCAIGFYFRKREEFEHFVEKFSEITAPMKRNLDYPVFALAEGKRVDVEEVDTSCGYARSSLSHTNSRTDEDDYILL